MRSNLVVIASPVDDDVSSLDKRCKPVLVEALVADLAIDSSQYSRSASACPAQSTGIRCRVVASKRCMWVAAEAGYLIQHADDVGATDAINVDALVVEVVDDRQALEPAPVGQRITDKVHAPHRI